MVYLVLQAFDVQFAADVGIDALGAGAGTFQGGVAFAVENEFVGLQGGVAVGVGVKLVLAAAPAGFAVNVDAGLCAHGYAHAHRQAGVAVFTVGLLLALAGFEDDVFGRIQCDGVAGFDLAVLGADVTFAAGEADVAAGVQCIALALGIAAVLLAFAGFKAGAGFGFEEGTAIGHGAVGLVALGGGGHALQGLGAAVGFVVDGAVEGVDQVNQRGRDFAELADFKVFFRLVAGTAVVVGQNIDALGIDTDVLPGVDVGHLLGVVAAGLNAHVAA